VSAQEIVNLNANDEERALEYSLLALAQQHFATLKVSALSF
jgi:hypothetical protein